MLSRTAEYAVRAMVALRSEDARRPLLARQVAERTGIPTNYLSKVLNNLARAGLVTGTRGRNGGYRLARPARQITAYDIVCEFDPLSDQRRCFLGNAVCSKETACPAHDQWDKVWSVYEKFLQSTTLDRLATASLVPEQRRRKPARSSRVRN